MRERLSSGLVVKPLVSVILAAHDADSHLVGAVESVLAQSLESLELVVVDDGSQDRTPALLEAVRDPRLIVVRNDERQGLAAALNRGLDHARARYVARLDADDLALPLRLERQVERLRAGSLGIVGSAILEIDASGRSRAFHEMPTDPLSVRWHALFSSPFYHPTVLLDRRILDRHHLRYDPAYQESEDYDLWTRLLAVAEGANLADPLVLYRVHALQASQRRRELQRSFQLGIALRQIDRHAHGLDPASVELAWSLGAGEPVPSDHVGDAVDAYLDLFAAFLREHGAAETRQIARIAARTVGRAALLTSRAERARLLRCALGLDPALPLNIARRRVRRQARLRLARRATLPLLGARDAGRTPVRVTLVIPEPTPYRSTLLDRASTRRELDLTVIYAGRSVQRRTWNELPLGHQARFLRGFRVPGVYGLLHHDYPVTPAIWSALGETAPDVVVVSGWSTFSSQAAMLWCRARGVPYVLLVESNDADPRAGWRRVVKDLVVPRVMSGARSFLAVGELSRQSLVARGAPSDRVQIFANTVDVEGYGERVDELAARRGKLRATVGVGPDDVLVLSVARLAPEKGLDKLIQAVARAGDPRLVLAVAGAGTEREGLIELARARGVRFVLLGELQLERLLEAYAAADIFALLSTREPWGVVVNEAAACGLPLLLSDRVGAAADLLRDGENGMLVSAGDVEAAGLALRRFAVDADFRRGAGARSRQLMQGRGYEPSIDALVAAAREAIASK
jgi:glycosyltransferase involved in cell wall biosynthesis